MKKNYITPDCELITFNKSDVIATSGEISAPWKEENDTKLPGVEGWS